MKNQFSTRGWTLVELLVVLAISAIIISVALPGLFKVVYSADRATSSNRIVSAFALARATAISKNAPTTLCPIDASNRCISRWDGAIAVFLDRDRDAEVDAGGHVIRLFAAPESGRLTVKGSSSRYFRFKPSGLADGTWGNLTLCPDDLDAHDAVHWVLSMGGRLRRARDLDGDGIVEKSGGDPVTCGST
ncbi:GspH/FimT family pseudopilin [Marinobacteraceae bacterium S3BR75-40.1]